MLDSLRIKNFRCFEDLQIESLGRVNLIVGRNNTGKSTLLEAVSVLANRAQKETLLDILYKRNLAIKEDFSTPVDTLTFLNNSIAFFRDHKAPEFSINELIFSIHDYEGSEAVHGSVCQFIGTGVRDEGELAKLWDHVYLNSTDNIVKDSLKVLLPDISSLAFTGIDRVCFVKETGDSKAVPLKALGEGVGRVLQVFLHAVLSGKGYLLIDEFENGLHYSIQQEVWEKLFRLAEELDIQVFATTHSKDTIESFYKTALKYPDIKGNIISLARSAAKSDFGKIFATVYDENNGDLDMLAETGIEVR